MIVLDFGGAKSAMSISSTKVSLLWHELIGLIIEARDGLVRVLVIIYVTVPLSNYNAVSKSIREGSNTQSDKKLTSIPLGLGDFGKCNSNPN